MTYELLTEHQREVAQRVLRDEESRRAHLCIALSGAHAYGFPSPDSDLDLKAIHVAPTRELLGLGMPRTTFDRLEVIEGVEIDYTSNELQMALAGILRGNGNYLERILGACVLESSPLLEELKPLVERALSRRFHAHYRGFATSQLRDAQASDVPTAKKLLYVLRTALTGAHLLLTGTVVTDLGAICADYGLDDAKSLIAAKRAGERVALSDGDRERWFTRVQSAFDKLDDARSRSPLPEEADPRQLEDWLVDVRTRRRP